MRKIIYIIKLFEENNFLTLQIDTTVDGTSMDKYATYKIFHKNDLKKLYIFDKFIYIWKY